MAAVVVCALGLGSAAGVLWWRHEHPPDEMAIPALHPADRTAPFPSRPAPRTPADPGPPFVTGVSPDHRYLLDQRGRPLLVRGESPWSLISDLSPAQVRAYLADRASYGVNALIMSLLGAKANGGPSDDGATYDGLHPFRDGDVTRLDDAYFDRAHAYLQAAAEQGMTVFLYPFDVWSLGRAFRPSSLEQCQDFGAQVGRRFADLPNLVWMSGGDYLPDVPDPARGSDADRCITAMMRGIRGTGDPGLFSIQLFGENSSDDPYWATKSDLDFVYSYRPTYQAVRRAWQSSPTTPAVLGESNYEGENNQPGTPTTTLASLRRQLWWSVTSGAAGIFLGTHYWDFHSGWPAHLRSPGMAQEAQMWRTVAALDWWRLRPDLTGRLLTGGQGVCGAQDTAEDVLQSRCTTAAASPDGSLAVVYLPSARPVRVDPVRLAAGVRAWWVDPATGARTTAGDPHRAVFAPPAGGSDWVLLFQAP